MALMPSSNYSLVPCAPKKLSMLQMLICTNNVPDQYVVAHLVSFSIHPQSLMTRSIIVFDPIRRNQWKRQIPQIRFFFYFTKFVKDTNGRKFIKLLIHSKIQTYGTKVQNKIWKKEALPQLYHPRNQKKIKIFSLVKHYRTKKQKKGTNWGIGHSLKAEGYIEMYKC